jgi:hypothetical protein
MRTCIVFLLAALLSLNAASAAIVGVCDALEHTQSHTAHVGHHSHEHNIADDHPSAAVPDEIDTLPAPGDHHHAHVHSGFVTLLSGTVDVPLFEGSSPLAIGVSSHFISAPHVRLDRPPCAALA